MTEKIKPVFYDLEIAPNRVLIGIGDAAGGFEWIDVKQPLDAKTRRDLDGRLNSGMTAVGYNNLGFDSYLLNLLFDGAPPERVYELSSAIINTREPAWKVAQGFAAGRSGYAELDLMHYTPRGRLKAYEARLGLAVRDLPFNPDKPIEDAALDGVVQYLAHDIKATKALYDAVKGDVVVRQDLESLFDMEDGALTSRTAASAAALVLATEYCRAQGDVELSDLRKAARRFWEGTMTFTGEPWLWEVCRGTVAEELLQQISGTRFEIIDGARQAADREWPSAVMVGGVPVSFGLGGLHSTDASWSMVCSAIDVASMYPHLFLLPGCAPMHMDEGVITRVYRRILEQRLAAKAAGAKGTSSALKLILNSSFGQMGHKYSPIFAPLSFLNITVSGQLVLIALADKVARQAEDNNG